jgi:predicted outer membrane repeat protein
VDIPSAVDPYMLMQANGVTMSIWFRMLTGSGDWAGIFDFCNSNTGDFFTVVKGTGNDFKLSFVINDPTLATPQTSYVTATNYNDNGWHHLVWTIGSLGVWSIYVDNVYINPAKTKAIYNKGFDRQHLGKRCTSPNNAQFLGNMDNFQVFSKVLSAAEVSTLYLHSSMVVWYPFENGVDNMWLDAASAQESLPSTNLQRSNALPDTANVARGSSSIKFVDGNIGQATGIPLSVNPATIMAANGITISMWYKMLTTAPNWANLFRFDGRVTGDTTSMFIIERANYANTLNFWCGDQNFNTGASTVIDNAWHHITWAISNTGMWTIYLDNSQILSSQKAISTNPANGWYWSHIGRNLLGNIDDFRIFSRVITVTEVRNLFTSVFTTAGIVAYYPFEGSTDSERLGDGLGGRSDYALTSSTPSFDSGSPARGAFSMKSNTDTIFPVTLNPYTIATSTGITVSFWLRMFSSAPDWAGVFKFEGRQGADTNSYFGVYRNGASSNLDFWCAQSVYGSSTPSVVNGQWHHIVWAIDTAGKWYIYIDGNIVSNGAITKKITNPAAGWYYRVMGRSSLDDFAIFSRTLTQSDVTAIFNPPATDALSFMYPGSGLGGVFSINASSFSINLTNATFLNNFAGHMGGAVHVAQKLSDTSSSFMQCTNCSFVGNTAWNRGSVIYSEKYTSSISLINSAFSDNCVSNIQRSSSRHAISMGYYFGTGIGGNTLTPLTISGTATSFSRSSWNDNISCPYIRGDEAFNISGINSSTAIFSGAADVMLPGISSVCPSNSETCNFSDFYTGDFREEPIVLSPSNSLSFLSAGWDDNLGRMVDSGTFLLQPGTYSTGACGLVFMPNSLYNNVTLVGNGTSPSDTVINCASSAFFATVNAGFTLTLKNLYIVRGNTNTNPVISVTGTLFTENVTIGGTAGTACTNYGILCTGTTATCNFAGNTTFEGINGCTASAVALYATASASVQMSGNLTVWNSRGTTYAIRLEQLTRSSLFNIQNLIVQNNTMGFLLIPSIASSAGTITFNV